MYFCSCFVFLVAHLVLGLCGMGVLRRASNAFLVLQSFYCTLRSAFGLDLSILVDN